jgi:nucleoside phosphorylase
METRVCMVGAVREEIAGVLREMRACKKIKLAGGMSVWDGVWCGIPVVLVRSGVGAQRARNAVVAVAEHFSIARLVSLGYAGGLNPDLDVGDLVVADRVLESPAGIALADSTPSAMREIRLDSPGVDLAIALADKLRRGTFLTVHEIVHRPELKSLLWQRYSAQAVEMETALLARWAQDLGVPFLAVRSITDTSRQELIDFSPLQVENGEVSLLKAGWYVLTHPCAVKDLVALGLNAKTATARLTEFLRHFLPQWTQASKDDF